MFCQIIVPHQFIIESLRLTFEIHDDLVKPSGYSSITRKLWDATWYL